mmetsp:Transcript_1537/g.3283  ORF Transcript_1537/g.3283 Transcript_1537/m.3283 type:complete len:366 (+) Transcript_1537:1957-3054(+)
MSLLSLADLMVDNGLEVSLKRPKYLIHLHLFTMSFTADCDICFEPFDPEEHAPLMLICGHTYCKRCITDIKQRHNSLECPNDRLQDKRHVSEMPKNYIVLEIIERVTQVEAAVVKPISLKESHDVSILERAIQNASMTDYKFYSIGYTGGLVNGLRNGYGVLKFTSDDVYEGDFVDDKMSGFGTLKSSEGYYFAGNFINGVRIGFGLQKWLSGAFYLGNYDRDLFNGQGKMTYSDGSCYEGDFIEGLKHGRGIYRWADGSEYKGTFKQDLFSEFGIMRYADGSIYDGYWENDKRSGKGRHRDMEGNVYIGYFYADQKHGRGVTKYIDGSIFRGSYVGNKKHGRGLYVNASGSRAEEVWRDGELIS